MLNALLKSTAMEKKKLIILVGGLAALCIFYFYIKQVNASSQRFENIAASYTEHQSIATIERDRQASIDKVRQIIERYNNTISDSLKNAIAYEIYVMSQKYANLNIDLIAATITHESAKTWDPTVTSKVGAMGLMQVMPTTGAFLAYEEGIPWTTAEQILYDPILNIRLGCRYLNELVGMYEEDGGLAAYNGGPRRAEMWIAANRNYQILWKETREYVPAVLELYDKFRTEGTL